MTNKNKKFGAALLAGALCISILSACSTSKPEAATGPSDAGQDVTSEGGQSSNIYDYPILGMTATLSDGLVQRMDKDVFLINNADLAGDGASLQYGVVGWYVMPSESGNEDEFNMDDMQCAGILGVYLTELADRLDELTGCDEHQEVGRSVDGAYVYYLSTNTEADESLTAEIRKTQVTLTDMAAIDASVDEPASEFSGTSVGEFATQDVNGTSYTQDIFKDYDLTLVNIFTTWCSPCVAEMPELEDLYQQMKDKGVGVVGVVLDVLNEKGEASKEDLERAQLLVEKTGVTYPILLPDATYFNGRLTGIQAFPETFFVDEEGNIVGETYSGSGDLEYWLSVVEKELANVKERA